MTAASDRRAAKEAAAKMRLCMDRQILHLRTGTWSTTADDWEPETTITLVGNVWDLHGTVCTCCPPRTPQATGGAA